MKVQRIKDEAAPALAQPVTHIKEISTQVEPDNFIKKPTHPNREQQHQQQPTQNITNFSNNNKNQNNQRSTTQMFQATRGSNSNSQPLPCVQLR